MQWLLNLLGWQVILRWNPELLGKPNNSPKVELRLMTPLGVSLCFYYLIAGALSEMDAPVTFPSSDFQ